MNEIVWSNNMTEIDGYFAKVTPCDDGWEYRVLKGIEFVRKDGAYICDESAKSAAEWVLRELAAPVQMEIT